MNGFKRAWLHLIRKKGTSGILFLLLLVMTTLMLTCLSIQSATDIVNANIKKALLGFFTINAKQLDGGITEESLEKIISVNGLSGRYTLRSYTYASYYSADGKSLEIKSEGASEIPEGYEHAGRIVANSNSNDDSYFTEAGFEMVEGESIVSTDKNVALIHQYFAEQNNLAIGDTIIFRDVMDNGRRVEAMVVGIFTNTEEQTSIGIAPSSDLYENIIFTDLTTASDLMYGAENGTSVEYGDFYVNDPDELDRIMEEVQEIPDMNWKKCTLTRYDNDYQNAKESLRGLQNIIFLAIVVVFLIGFGVLVLFLTLRLRDRIHETGIYLSMGISKGEILMQYLLEVLLVSVVALIFAYGVSSAICNRVGQTLFSQVTTDTYEAIKLVGNESGGKEAIQGSQEDLGLSDVEVTISTKDYQTVWMLILGICFVSIVLASYPILKVKPKNLLSHMS